jgi:hypothetical protein
MITCNECSKNFNSIVSHVRKHNLTPKQYLEKYPNSPLMSEEQKNKISSKTKEAMANPQTRENYLNSRKAIDYSKIKPIYDRTDKKIKERQYSKERNEKVSEARKKYWEDKKGKTVEELYGEEKGKEIRKNKSIQTSGENNPAYGKVYEKAGRIRGHYKGLFFRSLWEYSYLKFLESNGYCLEDIQYEKIKIKYTKNGSGRTYIPDYYINKDRLLIEIKSKWNIQNNLELLELKKEAAEKWCLENNSTYHILTEDDFPIFSYAKAKEDKDVVFC